jgi:hypothetical protein
MCADDIEAGGACVGYSLPYETVFDGVCFGSDGHDGEINTEEYYAMCREEAVENGEDESSIDEENEYTFIREAWSNFVNKKHPKLIASKIVPTIGCLTLPGIYEKIIKTRDCVVVFGFPVVVDPIVENSQVLCQIPVCNFPVEMPEIILDFIAFLRAEHPGMDHAPRSEPTPKKARKEIQLIKVPERPEVVTFVK